MSDEKWPPWTKDRIPEGADMLPPRWPVAWEYLKCALKGWLMVTGDLPEHPTREQILDVCWMHPCFAEFVLRYGWEELKAKAIDEESPGFAAWYELAERDWRVSATSCTVWILGKVMDGEFAPEPEPTT